MINNPRHSLVHHSEAVPTIVVADDGTTTIAEELRVGVMGCELRNCCDRIVIRTRVKQLFSGFRDGLATARLCLAVDPEAIIFTLPTTNS
jgi:hypothetical protein